MEFIKAGRAEGRIEPSFSCEGFLGPYEGEVRDDFFFCRAGINIGSVLADGSISACPSLRADYSQGNIYKDSFLDVWNNRFQVMRDRAWTKTGKCLDCGAFKWCGCICGMKGQGNYYNAIMMKFSASRKRTLRGLRGQDGEKN